MTDIDTTKVTLSEQEWSALPDEIKAAFEQDGESYVAEEAVIAELTKRTGVDADEDDSDQATRDDDDVDALPELKVEISNADYERLPADIQVAYERKGGRWTAVPAFREEIERMEGEYQAFVAQCEAEIAAKQAQIEKLDRQISDSVIRAAVRHQLTEAGCRPGLMQGAIALFVGDHAIHTTRQADGTYDIEVEGSDGRIDVPTAVFLWLQTDDGRAMLKEPPRKLH